MTSVLGGTTYEHILWEGPDADGVAVLTFNRPDVRNAFNEEMYAEVSDVLRGLRSADHIGAVLVTGAGETFCAGGDFSLIDRCNSSETHRRRLMDQGVQLPQGFELVANPVTELGLATPIALPSDRAGIPLVEDDATLAVDGIVLELALLAGPVDLDRQQFVAG